MSWRVAYTSAYESWLERDPDVRLQVLEWFVGLADGPPSDAEYDPSIGMYWATAPTGHRVEMFMFPDLLPPLIAIFRIRRPQELPGWLSP